jgi:hypothetical protein
MEKLRDKPENIDLEAFGDFAEPFSVGSPPTFPAAFNFSFEIVLSKLLIRVA